MKSESMAVDSLVQRKRQALRFFVEQLLSSEVKDSIAKIILRRWYFSGRGVLDDSEEVYTVADWGATFSG